MTALGETRETPRVRRRARAGGPRVLRWIARAVVLALLAALVWVGSVGTRVWWVARQDARPRSDAILVLGASQFDGRPSEIFRARLDHARRLFAAGVAPRIVTVGGNQPGDRFTEASAGRRYLVSAGVPAGKVLAVEQGSNTLGSLEAVERVFAERGWRSVVLVSDPWHAFRSREMAEHVGLHAATSPARSGPVVQTRGTEARYIVRETLAYIYFRVTGHSDDSGPTAALGHESPAGASPGGDHAAVAAATTS